MAPLLVILFILATWLGILVSLAFLFLVLCVAFGSSKEPAAVPNKAVWG
jgi:hypothetical protein